MFQNIFYNHIFIHLKVIKFYFFIINFSFLFSHFTDKPISKEDDLQTLETKIEDQPLKLSIDPDYLDFNPLNEYMNNICKNWNYDIFILQNLTKGNVLIEFGYNIFKYFR